MSQPSAAQAVREIVLKVLRDYGTSVNGWALERVTDAILTALLPSLESAVAQPSESARKLVTAIYKEARATNFLEAPEKLREMVNLVEAYKSQAVAQARLDEFDLIVRERPADPIYWDMHHRRDLAAIAKEPVK